MKSEEEIKKRRQEIGYEFLILKYGEKNANYIINKFIIPYNNYIASMKKKHVKEDGEVIEIPENLQYWNTGCELIKKDIC